ncbi:MAG: type II toxin-antitoxin system death-on-curing family toxin [Patescibacteria group bacterium]|nr:type II toxin-antitoxin system death-on-curing family toxin [Patescibacteria group bacterium]
MAKPSKDLPKPKWIGPEDFEFICFNLTRELMTFDEPIPDYSTREKSLLESSLALPKQTFDKKLLYPTLVSQGIALFYSLIKNHPFVNGNKRIAVMSLLVFLRLNGKWLDIPPKMLYEVAVLVAESDPKNKENIIKTTETLFKKYLVSIKK